jgi:hypothetical protein
MDISNSRRYAVVAAALVVAVVAATAFTGVISAINGSNSTYDTDKADISFVSFCKENGSAGTAPSSDSIVEVTFEEITKDGVTKVWQVSYDVADSPTVDYVILKGGNENSPTGYIIRIDDPTSPVTVFQGSEIDVQFPEDFGEGNACLAGDSGVKFDSEENSA